jgi:predicted nucleic acid-binding protein
MKIFLDANILVSVLNKEYPVFTYSSRILSLSANSRVKLYTSPICMAIAFYFAEKKSGSTAAKKKMALLEANLKVSSVNHATVSKCLENKRINDFEDGLEYYSALEAGCDFIVTEDTGDFYFSEIEVMTSEGFLKKYFKELK